MNQQLTPGVVEVRARVISFNKRTGDYKLAITDEYRHLVPDQNEIELSGPSFFGGEFAPYPKAGDVVNLHIRGASENTRTVMEAWTDQKKEESAQCR